MSKFYFLLSILFFFVTCCSRSVIKDDAHISFAETEHDFGSLPFKQAAAYYFEFSNPGKTALVIHEVTTSCGCTIAKWTRKPVMPDDSGIISISYDAAIPGVFRKEIVVRYNGADSPVVLKIKGMVRCPDEEQRED